MNSDEKYSDVLAVVWNEILATHATNVLLENDDVFSVIVRIVTFLENNHICRHAIHHDNVSIIIEQILILLYSSKELPIESMDTLQDQVRKAMKLLKDDWLFQNLERRRKQKCCLFI